MWREATQRLCEGYFEFRALGPTAVKGLNQPVDVYEVVRAGPLRTHFQLAARRGLTKFVGREREMAATRWSRPRRDRGRSLRQLARRARANRASCTSSRLATSPAGWCWKRSRSRTARPGPT